MPRPTIDQIRSIGNVTQLFRWNLIFSAFPAAVAGAPRTEDLNLRCESTTLPKLSHTMTEVQIRGHKVHQPGKGEYSPNIALTFLETVDNKISTFLRAWREACWQVKTGVSQSKADVEAQILIQRLNHLDQGIWEYNLTGCILQDYEPGGTLSSESQDALKPSMTIVYDYFEDKPL